MGEVADILKAVHEIFNDGEVEITVDSRNLGMAYAIPSGQEETVVEDFGPWHDVELKQVFFEQSSVLEAVLAEIQLILTWRFSEAQQYIIEVFLTKKVISIDPTVSVAIRVRFDNPAPGRRPNRLAGAEHDNPRRHHFEKSTTKSTSSTIDLGYGAPDDTNVLLGHNTGQAVRCSFKESQKVRAVRDDIRKCANISLHKLAANGIY